MMLNCPFLLSFTGTEYTLRGYAIATIVILAIYLLINYFHQDRGHMGLGSHQPHSILEETSQLAPCGVPMNISRNLSNTNIEDMQKDNSKYTIIGGVY